MQITYIKELQNWQELLGEKIKQCPLMLQKICYYLKKCLKISRTIKKNKNVKLKILPYTIEELSQKQKWYNKNIEKEKSIILSKELLKNNMQNTKQNIWDGKWLLSYLVIEIIEYISEKIKIPIEQLNVAIVISDTTEKNIQTILQLAQKVKKLSIVTKNINKLLNIEQRLYEENGIAIKISNNKKRSLKKEKIIINMDVKEPELKQYEICRTAIIINVKESINYEEKGFMRN